MFGADVTFTTFVNGFQELYEAAPKLDSTSAHLVTREKYLTDFNITTKVQLDTRPLGLVAMYDAEDPLLDSLWEERVEEFSDLGLHELFGISLIEYLDLPRYKIIMLNQIAARCKKKRHGDRSSELAKLEQQMRAAGINIPAGT